MGTVHSFKTFWRVQPPPPPYTNYDYEFNIQHIEVNLKKIIITGAFYSFQINTTKN